jgi:hypothetical protein
MLLRTLIHTLLIWAVWFLASSLLRESAAPGLRLVERALSIHGGLPFAAATAIGLNNVTAAAIPLVLAVLLSAYPFPTMSDLASTLAPIGLGLLLGSAARGLGERPDTRKDVPTP